MSTSRAGDGLLFAKIGDKKYPAVNLPDIE